MQNKRLDNVKPLSALISRVNPTKTPSFENYNQIKMLGKTKILFNWLYSKSNVEPIHWT